WRVARPVPEPAALDRAAEVIRSAKRPVLIAGGGAIYSEASEALASFTDATSIPVLDTQAGKGALSADHPLCIGGVGSTGNNAANELAAEADVVIGVGTRYTDFTTASHTAFRNPEVRFVNLNVKAFDAAKHSASMVVTDAREGLEALRTALDGYRAPAEHTELARARRAEWEELVAPCFAPHDQELPAQTEIFGALNELMGDEDIVINAAGSMPGDLQALWQARSPVQYHLEYGYSCMGYELPASLGAKMARPQSEVVAIIGDGTFQMAPQEIATIVSERVKVILVILNNHGWSSIGSLSESHGSQRFGTRYRMRNEDTGLLDGELVPLDIPANIRSYGIEVQEVSDTESFRAAYRRAESSAEATAIVVNTNLYGPNPPGNGWRDVPVSRVSRPASTQRARADSAHPPGHPPPLRRRGPGGRRPRTLPGRLPARRELGRGHRDRGQHQPVRPQPARKRLVGRPGLAGLEAGIHPDRPRRLRAPAVPAAPLPLTRPPRGPSAAPPAPAAHAHPPFARTWRNRFDALWPHRSWPPRLRTCPRSMTPEENQHGIRDHPPDRRPGRRHRRLHAADHE